MQASLNELKQADLLRQPRQVESACGAKIVVEGKEVICLCSNDYLALAADPAVRAAAAAAIEKWGLGTGASRLISGTTAVHVELERRLAKFKQTEAAIVTSTGWMANHIAIHALAGAKDLVLCDKLDHASIVDAALACGARLRTFAHCDMDRLEQLLQRHRSRYKRCLIVTDSLFSMDGDFAPLQRLVELKQQYDALLLIDEAHATGVIGPGGRGVADLMGLEDKIDATVGTLSKAIGSLGGFVAGPGVLIDYLRNTARAYIYTTAAPAALCAAAIASLQIIQDQPQRRRDLLETAEWLRSKLQQRGMKIGSSQSQIFPIHIGEAGRAVEVSRELFERGFFAPAIRPPTVPRSASRLRVSLCSAHEKHDLDRFISAMEEVLAL